MPDTEEAHRILAANNAGEPVGYRVTWEPFGDDPCMEGCMAPGSSPHSHRRPVGFRLFGHTAYVETDLDMNVRAAGVIHQFKSSNEKGRR